jgi:hypothetical protein
MILSYWKEFDSYWLRVIVKMLNKNEGEVVDAIPYKKPFTPDKIMKNSKLVYKKKEVYNDKE